MVRYDPDNSVANISILICTIGMHDLALKSFTEAREMIEAQLSPGHKEVATILINIGLVHLAKRQ
jgi:hypothetical protein